MERNKIIYHSMPFYELKKIEKQKGEECLSNEIFVKLQNFKSQKKGCFVLFCFFPSLSS